MGRQEQRERYHDMTKRLFKPGDLYIGPQAEQVCQSLYLPPEVLVIRHVTGDVSNMTPKAQEGVRRAIEDGTRVFSAYQYGEHRFFVITEADRSRTTILLAGEY
jgi:hypothetical protein